MTSVTSVPFRRISALLLAVVLAASALLVGAFPADARKPAAAGAAFELTILHNNDGESKLFPSLAGNDPARPYAGVAYFKTLVDQLKAEALTGPPRAPGAKRGVVMLSSGDNFLAGPEFTASLRNGVPYYDAIALDLVGYDAMAIGNHEFDFGPEVLADFITSFGSGVPFLSANLDVSGEPSLAALEAQGRIAKSTVIKERGELIGVVGATTPQLPNISSPGNVVASEVFPAVQDEVDALTAAGVNKIILISHLQNVNEDLALAELLSGVDVIIAGGGDEFLRNAWNPISPGDLGSPPTPIRGPYPLTATDDDGVTVPVITTPGDYKYVGKLVVQFDGTGNLMDVVEEASGPVRVMGHDDGMGGPIVTSDPTIEELVLDPVSEFIAVLDATILADSEVALDGRRPQIRQRETNLGNLTADSMLWQAQQLAGSVGAETPLISLQNGGGIRNNSLIPAGEITELDTFRILSFSNFVSIMGGIDPSHLKDLLETSISGLPGENGRFGHWGGLSFTYDVAQPGRAINSTTCAVSAPGARVQDVWIGAEQIFDDGVALVDDTWTVAMATNDFTFRGGDCYDFQGMPFTNVTVTYQQALANYLTSPDGLNGTISAAQYPETPPAPATRIIPI